MFRVQSFSCTDLDDQIRFFIGSEDKRHIVNLLQATKNFMSSTSPDFQVQRQLKSEAELLLIVNAIGDGLQSFQNAPDHAANDDMYLRCVETITERVEFLKLKEDRIFALYKANENSLKNHLQHVAPQVKFVNN